MIQTARYPASPPPQGGGGTDAAGSLVANLGLTDQTTEVGRSREDGDALENEHQKDPLKDFEGTRFPAGGDFRRDRKDSDEGCGPYSPFGCLFMLVNERFGVGIEGLNDLLGAFAGLFGDPPKGS